VRSQAPAAGDVAQKVVISLGEMMGEIHSSNSITLTPGTPSRRNGRGILERDIKTNIPSSRPDSDVSEVVGSSARTCFIAILAPSLSVTPYLGTTVFVICSFLLAQLLPGANVRSIIIILLKVIVKAA
jgi:hypothetical protein